MGYLLITFLALGCGIYYLAVGYQFLVGIVQVVLGAMCLGLVGVWQWTEYRDKKKQKTMPPQNP